MTRKPRAPRTPRAPAPPPEPGLPVVDRFGLETDFTGQLDPWFDFLFDRWFRVQLSGLENLPSDGRALLVSNHSGAFPWDALMIYHALAKHARSPRRIRFLADKLVSGMPFLSWLAQRTGFVLACRENALRLLEEGQLVGVFPEGTKGTGKLFRDRYKLARFGRGGFVEVALETRAPVLPVSVVGAEETHPILYKPAWLAKMLGVPYVPVTPTLPWLGVLGLVPLPVQFHIHFGKPLRFKEAARERARDFTVVHAVNGLIRSRIREGLEMLLSQRRSVF